MLITPLYRSTHEHHEHHHDCTDGTCHIHHSPHKPEHKHEHKPEHKHEHKPEHTHEQKKTNIFTITNLILVAATFVFDQLMGRLTNNLTDKIQPSNSTKQALNLGFYGLQMFSGMALWSLLAKVIPQIHLKNGRFTAEPTDLMLKHSNKLTPALHEAMNTISWKYLFLISAVVTTIEGIKIYIEQHLDRHAAAWQHLALNVSDQIAKIIAIILTDSWVHNKQLTLSSFWQSMTVDVCECHGTPRLACPSNLAPFVSQSIELIRNGYKQLTNNTLSAIT